MGSPQRGSASVEQIGLLALVALLMLTGIAALIAHGAPERPTAELATAIQRHIRCPAALPDPCWRDPLTTAYGRSVAGAVRALAPTPRAVFGPSGLPLVPVDFRRCRSESCAVAGPDAGHLTASNRRVTAFTSVARDAGGVRITYWLYRPGLGWSSEVRRATPSEVTALAATPLLDSADPVLVPLETLAGRDSYDFPPGEEPPWRGQITSVYRYR
jgi:hypothetical protein